MNYLGENGDYRKWKDEKEVVINNATRVHEQIPIVADLSWIESSRRPP